MFFCFCYAGGKYAKADGNYTEADAGAAVEYLLMKYPMTTIAINSPIVTSAGVPTASMVHGCVLCALMLNDAISAPMRPPVANMVMYMLVAICL